MESRPALKVVRACERTTLRWPRQAARPLPMMDTLFRSRLFRSLILGNRHRMVVAFTSSILTCDNHAGLADLKAANVGRTDDYFPKANLTGHLAPSYRSPPPFLIYNRTTAKMLARPRHDHPPHLF
jgi:hypothetical protein